MTITFDEINNCFIVTSNGITTTGKRSKEQTIERHIKRLEQKKQSLENRIPILEDRKYEQQLDEHRKFNNLGWGYGMRGYHRLKNLACNSDKTETKINDIKEKIKEIEKEIAI
jgi:chaperonin cofactor prefoldin